MESLFTAGHPNPEDGNQKLDQTNIFDCKVASPIRVEAEIKEGEDYPDLYYFESVFMKNKIVIFGRKDSNRNKNKGLIIYDLEKDAWQNKPLKGKFYNFTKYFHTANAIGNSIFIIGSGGGYSRNKNVYKIDFETQKCQIIGEIVDHVYQHTANVHKQSIYIFAGISHNKPTSKLQKFNLLTNQCEVIKLIHYQPIARHGHKSVIHSDNLYVFGGMSDDNNSLQDFFSVDLSNNVSTKIDSLGLIPSPRWDFNFFAFEDHIYLFGGQSWDEFYSDFYRFNVYNKTWYLQQAKNQKCLLKRADSSTVVVKESTDKLKVYIIGGYGEEGGNYKNMNVLTITSNRMYWVLHYLESTGIHNLPGLCLVQEIIEMFE